LDPKEHYLKMGRFTHLFVFLFPVAFANQFFYYPAPLTYYVPSSLPLVPVPSVYNTIPHGNRRHELVTPTVYHECDKTVDWQDTETGAVGNMRVKRPAPSTYAASNEVELIFDRPLANLVAFNGVVSAQSKTNFKITTFPFMAYSLVSNEITLNLKADFDPSQPRPKLTGYVAAGVYHGCKPEKPTKVSTKSVRLAPHAQWPAKVMGLYVLLADDSEEGFESNADWEPELFEWQQVGSNVLFFTFIHPDTMDVPPSFQKLAASRGTDQPGAVPKDTVIMFAIGGYAYSLKPNPWHWLTSKEAAEKMAEKVAKWPEQYGCDGIDLDLEEGAGARREAGPNMIHFIRRVKELAPNMIVSQPVYGYPQVQAESDVINASWDTEGNHQGLADSIGLMVYEGTQALNYVKNYANGAGQWQGFPIKVSAPTNTILLGAKGSSSSNTITQLAKAAVDQDLLGIMVWYASVKNGFDYAPFWDASTREDSIDGYKQAMRIFNQAMSFTKDIVQEVDNEVKAA
jgi:hypothetical protein